ncbi:hypothetical protein ABPG74_011571 [Tetrahymena malaccensis]
MTQSKVIISANSYYYDDNQLGKGSFGEVKKGVYIDPNTKQKHEAAVKIIKPQLQSSQDKENKYYKNEIQICSKICKSQQEYEAQFCNQNQQTQKKMNLIRIFEVIETESCAFIVMEYCEQNLETYKQTQVNKRLDILQATKITKQILQGIKTLHSMNIIHRDLKPDNIFINSIKDSQEYDIKIADFNVSMICESQSPVGTISYMAPEQVYGIAYSDSSYKIQYSEKIDIWAVGTIMHEMITGIQLFPGNYPKIVTKDIIKFGSYKQKWEKSAFLDPSAIPANVMKEQRCFISFYIPWQRINLKQVAYLIDNLLKNKPEERYTADQALEEIEKILTSEELPLAVQNNIKKEIHQKQQEIQILSQSSLRHNQTLQQQNQNTNYPQQQYQGANSNNAMNQFNIQPQQLNLQNPQNMNNNFQQNNQNVGDNQNKILEIENQRQQSQQMVNYQQPFQFDQNIPTQNNNNFNNNIYQYSQQQQNFNQNQIYQQNQYYNPQIQQNLLQNFNQQANQMQTYQDNQANIQSLQQQMQNIHIQPQQYEYQNTCQQQTQNIQANYFEMSQQFSIYKINHQITQQQLQNLEEDYKEFQQFFNFLCNPLDQSQLQAKYQNLNYLISYQKMNIKGYISNLVINQIYTDTIAANTDKNLMAFKTYRLYPFYANDQLQEKKKQFQELVENFCKIYDMQTCMNQKQSTGADIKRITYIADGKEFSYNLDKNQLEQKLQNINQINVVFEYYDTNLEDFLKQIKKRQLDHKQNIVIKEKLIVCSIISQQLQALHENYIFHGQLNVRTVSFCQKQQQFFLNYYCLQETQQAYQKDGFYFEQSYMSPQQLQYQNTTFEDDIWALGAIFHYILTLTPLFQPINNVKDLVNKYSQNYSQMYTEAQKYILSSEEEKKRYSPNNQRAYSLLDKIPNQDIADLINKMLSKDPKERPKIQEITKEINKQKLMYSQIHSQEER